MIRPVKIHGIFDEVDESVNNKGFTPTKWLERKKEYKVLLDTFKISDPELYDRLLEEFNDGLLFNIEFKFLMFKLGFNEDEIDEIVRRFDAGEKPYGTNENLMSKPNKSNFKIKENNKSLSIEPSRVADLLDSYREVNEINSDGIKRGR